MTGKWTLYISGKGQFAGPGSVDADTLAKAFVDQLKAAGQILDEVTFCFPTCTDVLTGLPKP